MQELDIQPTNPTPYTPVGGTYNFNPQPGAGGLPSLSGLSRNVNPMARQLQAQGRGQDSMLVHMTPDEVNSLQGLASLAGTTMTVNPNTGLPEAGLLGNVFKKLLPSLIGAGLMFIPGVNAVAAAGIVGGGSTLLTGSLKKGLMAGLSAYGGASLARGLGAGVQNMVPPPPTAASAATQGVKQIGTLGGVTPQITADLGTAATSTALQSAPSLGSTIAAQAPKSLINDAAGVAAKKGLAALPGNFAKAAQAGLPGGIIGKAAPMLAASGLLSTASGAIEATKKPGQGPEPEKTWDYEGPYFPQERIYDPQATGPGGQGEIQFFRRTNPFPGYMTAAGGVPKELQSQFPTGFAEGGDVTKMSHEDLISKGFGGSQLPAGANPGSVADLGGQTFVVNAQGRWEPYKAAAPAAPAAPPPPPITSTINTSGLAGMSAADALKAINPEPNKLSNAAQQNRLGATLLADMPRYTEMYQSSPGAITAPLQYPGGTFNEQVRAQMAQPRQERTYNFTRPTVQPQTMQDYLAEYYRKYGTVPSGIGDIPPGDMSYAKGGVHMDDGAFVVDARTVSELGNGSSSAGQELLARLGGRPIKGPGDGVSDSIPANIGGTQEARVARDEVVFPAKAVKRLGGAKKLYALMDKAHKARKKADRGEDTKLRKGLGAL